ncbi:MAG: PIN domain-containing protein [Ilumatobacteraceae bacterium]
MSLAVALADANVLIPRTLRDYIVYAAEAGALQLHWSQSILDEMSRNLIAKFGFTPDDAAELELRLTEYLPKALIEVRRRDTQVVAKVEMDAKDRHVVAAALSAKATILVTDNPRHFPTDWLAERKIGLLTPAELLRRLAADQADALRTAHRLTVANSPKSQDAILATLKSQIGDVAADAVRRAVIE